MRRAIVLILLLAACSSSPPKAANTINVVGYLNLTDNDANWTAGEPCAGQGGYDDLAEGTPVTVKNEAGAIIATGAIVKTNAPKPNVCTLIPLVEDVPKSKFYSVEVSHRGESNHPASEVGKDGYLHLALTIGP